MSKYIKSKQKKGPDGQVKPKLKVKVLFNEEEHYLNEYDAFQMLSDLNVKVGQLGQAVQGIIDAMNAATNTTPTVQTNAPIQQTLKLPKLQTSKIDDGTKFYPNSSEEVKLES